MIDIADQQESKEQAIIFLLLIGVKEHLVFDQISGKSLSDSDVYLCVFVLFFWSKKVRVLNQW